MNQSQNSDFVEQADVNYRHNGLDVFAMVRFDKTTSLQNDILEQTAFTDTIWTQKNYQHSNTDSRSIDGRIGFNYDFNEYHSIGVRYDLSNALHTDMFTAFDSEIQQMDCLTIFYIVPLLPMQNHNRNISLIFTMQDK